MITKVYRGGTDSLTKSGIDNRHFGAQAFAFDLQRFTSEEHVLSANDTITVGEKIYTATVNNTTLTVDNGKITLVSGAVSFVGDATLTTDAGTLALEVDNNETVTVTSAGTVSGLAKNGDKVTGNNVTVTLTADEAAIATFAAADANTPAGVSAVTGKVNLATLGGSDKILFPNGTVVEAGFDATATYEGLSLTLIAGVYSAIADGTAINVVTRYTVSLEQVFTMYHCAASYSSDGGLTNLKAVGGDSFITTQLPGEKPLKLTGEKGDVVNAKAGTIASVDNAGELILKHGEFTTDTVAESQTLTLNISAMNQYQYPESVKLVKKTMIFTKYHVSVYPNNKPIRLQGLSR